MEATIINAENIMAMPLEALQATILSVLSGDLKVKEGSLVHSEKSGPRGPTAKVLPRLEACRSMFLEMAGRPEGVNAKELLGAANDRFVYTDILLVARYLIGDGLIQESRKGRKATWNLTNEE